MANRFSAGIKKMLLRKNTNLISLDEPFFVMERLLKDRSVTGIIDAGASHGHISARFLKRFPKAHVYAFEPNPMYAAALGRYEKEEPRFHCFFQALSDKKGLAELHITRSAGNTSLLRPSEQLRQIDPEGSDIRDNKQVELISIDEWAQQNGNPAIQLMKFDIQGYEVNALRGAVRVLQESTLMVYSEIWFNTPYDGGALVGDIDSFLRQQGFYLFDIYKPKYDRSGRIMWANAIFLSEKLL